MKRYHAHVATTFLFVTWPFSSKKRFVARFSPRKMTFNFQSQIVYTAPRYNTILCLNLLRVQQFTHCPCFMRSVSKHKGACPLFMSLSVCNILHQLLSWYCSTSSNGKMIGSLSPTWSQAWACLQAKANAGYYKVTHYKICCFIFILAYQLHIKNLFSNL